MGEDDMAENDWQGHVPELTGKAEQGDGNALKATMASILTIEERFSFLQAVVSQNVQDRLVNEGLPKLNVDVELRGLDVEMLLLKGDKTMWIPLNEARALVLEHDTLNESGHDMFSRSLSAKELK
jgi:hypothetical protein